MKKPNPYLDFLILIVTGTALFFYLLVHLYIKHS